MKDSRCKIYELRPFECQLYPFLINKREEKVFLAIDLGCPFVKENLESQELKDYTQYIFKLLNQPSNLEKIRKNPQIIQVYKDAKDLLALNI